MARASTARVLADVRGSVRDASSRRRGCVASAHRERVDAAADAASVADDASCVVSRARCSRDVARHARGRASTSASNACVMSCEYEVVRARRANGNGPAVFVVPGNPGVARFYEAFATALGERLDARTVDVIGYLGHTECARPNRSEWFTLEEQKAHVRDYVDARLREEAKTSNTECVVVGHSIGAHLALFTAKELGYDRVTVVLGLMPFLHVNGRSMLQRFLSLVTRARFVAHVVGRFVDALGVVAPALRSALLRLTVTRSMDSTAAEITSSWLRWQSLINMVFMGRTEFDALTRAVDECELVTSARARGRFAALYALDDHWAPLHQRDALASLGVDVTTVEDAAVRHDFVVVDAATRVVVDRAAALFHRLRVSTDSS